ncbi:hypothetical protein B0H34DRAFT_677573 [Crassisporium funariophilum]|nr:hypothetical protein B0H34DRAFT_677573 [Crassisporium funariophilum]
MTSQEGYGSGCIGVSQDVWDWKDCLKLDADIGRKRNGYYHRINKERASVPVRFNPKFLYLSLSLLQEHSGCTPHGLKAMQINACSCSHLALTLATFHLVLLVVLASFANGGTHPSGPDRRPKRSKTPDYVEGLHLTNTATSPRTTVNEQSKAQLSRYLSWAFTISVSNLEVAIGHKLGVSWTSASKDPQAFFPVGSIQRENASSGAVDIAVDDSIRPSTYTLGIRFPGCFVLLAAESNNILVLQP